MKAVVVDDERNCLEILEWMLAKYFPEIEIAAMCESPVEAIQQIKKVKPDLIFLDIEMPQFNGFEMLEKLGMYDFDVIFTTAYNQFAIRALKISALDYLLKPIDTEEFKTAVNKAIEKKTSIMEEQLEILMEHFRNSKPKAKRVALTASDHLVFVDTERIIYCESDSNYTQFFLTTGEKIVVSKTLKDVEEILQGNDFFRIHASFLVNMKHVSKFTRGDGGYVVMSNNQHLTVSRKKKEDFFEMFSKL